MASPQHLSVLARRVTYKMLIRSLMMTSFARGPLHDHDIYIYIYLGSEQVRNNLLQSPNPPPPPKKKGGRRGFPSCQ